MFMYFSTSFVQNKLFDLILRDLLKDLISSITLVALHHFSPI